MMLNELLAASSSNIMLSRMTCKEKPSLRYQMRSLCDHCRRSVLPWVLEETRYGNDHYIGRFDGQESLAFSDCPLCRLLAAMIAASDSRTSAVHHLWAFPQHIVSGLMMRTDKRSTEDGTILGICRTGSQQNLAARYECFSNGLIARVGERAEAGHFSIAQLVNREISKTDYSTVRSWISHCDTKHKASCAIQNSHHLLPDFKCINVRTRRIVSVPIGTPYFALSWVWGSPAPEIVKRITTAGTFVGELPSSAQSITDAMKVTHELDLEYLWVDQYCIEQEDKVVRHLQIQNMDKIYEHAEATLIAAPLIDKEVGLPGVSRPRSLVQPVLWIDDVCLTSTLPQLSRILTRTKWITRGWTYQEAVLSRRAIYFTDQQLYFVCQGMSCHESVSWSPSADSFSLASRNSETEVLHLNFMGRGSRESSDLWKFFDNLHHYKNRTLSFQEDSLNAFQGILARSIFENVWGVPIAPQCCEDNVSLNDLVIGFARGLWWENPRQNVQHALAVLESYMYFSRNPHFPSWSWAGWTGTTQLHQYYGDSGMDEMCNEIDYESFNLEIALNTRNRISQMDNAQMSNGQVSLLDWWCLIKSGKTTPSLSKVLHVKATICRIKVRWDPTVIANPYVCSCEYTSLCTNRSKNHSRNQVRFFIDPGSDSLNHDIHNNFFDAVVLFRLKQLPEYSAAWIVRWVRGLRNRAEVTGLLLLPNTMLATLRQVWHSFELQ